MHNHPHPHEHTADGGHLHLHADHAAADCRGPSADLDRRRKERAGLTFALGVTATIFVAELVGAWLASSLALAADAGHLFTDLVGLAISLAGIAIASRPGDAKRTWGWYRLEILSALANGVLLAAAAVMIIREAAERAFSEHAKIDTNLMITFAAIGLAANFASIVPLARLRKSLTVRAAFTHALGDAVNAVGVIIAGVLIAVTGRLWIDSLVSVLIATTIGWSAWRLIREAVDVLLEGIPLGIERAAVLDALASIDGVKGVHDMHIWTITSGMFALSCHVSVTAGAERDSLLTHAKTILHDRFGIDHSTIQIEGETWSEIGLVH